MKKITLAVAVVFVMGMLPVNALTLAEYTDQSTYLSDVTLQGLSLTVIDFTGFTQGTVITNQYAGLGAVFADGNDSISYTSSFHEDGVGIDGNGRVDIHFGSAMTHVGVDFPGALTIDFYQGTSLLASSSNFAGVGAGFFGGSIASSGWFDRVVLRDWVDDRAYIDTLYFGGAGDPVPEPATMTLLGLGLVGMATRRLRRK